MSRWFVRLIVVYVLLVVVGIVSAVFGPVFFSDDTRTLSREEDISGTYHLNADAAAFVRAHYPPVETSLRLERDGSFQFSNVPDCCFRPYHGTFISAHGLWKLLRIGSRYELELHMSLDPAAEPYMIDHLHLKRQHPPYEIEFWNDDTHSPMRFEHATTPGA